MIRPVIALAMLEGLVDHAFTKAHITRLEAVGELIDRVPLTRFDDDRAASALGCSDVLLGHWGCPTLTPEVLECAPRLRLFAYAAGTVKWQITDAVWARGIVVTSAAAANAVPVAEYTVAMIVLANKGALLFRERLRNASAAVPLDPARVGNVGKRVGLVGASLVGRHVIALLEPYSLELAVYDPYLGSDEAKALGVEKVDDLDALCASVDVLSVHAPDVDLTRNMIGAPQLAALRDGSVFINTARPALVDQDALLEHLQSGRISAVLDVATPDPLPAGHALLELPNVFVTPHIAGSMGTELHRMSDLAVDEVERFARAENDLAIPSRAATSTASHDAMTPQVRRARRITGMSAVLLPFRDTGAIDWSGFGAHLDRTIAAGLIPALNMDTGFGPVLDPAARTRVLAAGAQCGVRFLAGAHVADAPDSAFALDHYRAQLDAITDAGGTPIIFPSHGLTSLDEDALVAAHESLTREVDQLYAFELGAMFHPAGRVYSLDVFRALLTNPKIAGLKHSSLDREQEWARLAIRDEARPGFELLTGNDLAIDMVIYGSDYLLGLSTFAPDAFAARDAAWAAGDGATFWALNDVLQYLGQISFRVPVPAYRHNAAMFLKQRGQIECDATHPTSPARPESDRALLDDVLLRLDALL